MTEPQYIETSLKARLGIVALTIMPFLLDVAFKIWVQPQLNWIASLPTCESLPWVRLELLVAVAVAWLLGFSVFRVARRIATLGQVPVPGTWVWSRTRVRTGAYPKYLAFALYTLSAVLVVAPVLLVAWSQVYVVFCFPDSCGC